MKIPNYLKGLALMLMVVLGSTMEMNAQCSPTFTGPKCVGAPLSFFNNSPGATNISWDFNGEGTSNNANPTFAFNTPGVKDVCVTLKTGTGADCKSCVKVIVAENPVVNAVLTTQDTQCFLNNEFCFIDSSRASSGSTLKRVTYTWSDGEKQEFTSFTSPFTLCKKFANTNGGTYDMTVEIEDANGCIVIKQFPALLTVRASLGLGISIPSKQACDSVKADLTNTSKIDESQIKWFKWDFGDGTTNNKDWRPAPDHWYFFPGPRDGWWDVSLEVESVFGCKEKYVAANAVRNLLLDVRIISDKDSSCLSEPEFCFEIQNLVRKPGGGYDTMNTIPGITGFIWDFGHPNPPTPQRYNNQSLQACHSYGMGPFQASFTYQHPICGNRKVFDTILVIGPSAAIESPGIGSVIMQHHRYQCKARDTVQFLNNSVFYHNDPNMWDDDSTYWNHNPLGHVFDAAQHSIELGAGNIRENQHVTRLWDFGDQYAPRCTTNTKAGINVGKNCNFSMDSLPVHWFSDWEDIYRDSFYAKNRPFNQIRYNDLVRDCYMERLDTFKPAAHREYFWKNIPTVFNVRLTLQDTVHPLKCKHSSSTIISLLGASAKKLRFSGVYCLGGASPNYGVNLHLDDTKPGATSNWAWVNWDVNLDPNAWVKLHDTMSGSVQLGPRPGGLPVMLPYRSPGAPSNGMYGTTYSTAYSPAMIKDRKSGCVKIGLIIGTGVTYNPPKYPECVDTQYYEDAVCFPVIDPSFEILEPEFRAVDNSEPLKVCKGDEIVVKLTDDNLTNTEVVNFLEWRIGTKTAGPDTNLTYEQRIFESYQRNVTDPTNSKRLRNVLISSRFDRPLQAEGQNVPDVIISEDTIVTAYITEWDTAIDFGPIWEQVATRLEDVGFDIYELTSAQIRNMFGKPNCGLDTTGLSKILKELEYIEPIKTTVIHHRDSTILPFEERIIGGKKQKVVVFKPAHNGIYNLSFALDGGKDHCVSFLGKPVGVGFYTKVWYSDSIVCHQDLKGLKAKATFQYYNFNPFYEGILDPHPYWDPKKNPGRNYGPETHPNRKEDFVKWDWSIGDDDPNVPLTIFGGSPYSSTGYDSLVLGGGVPSSIYYKKHGMYTMRITTGDSSLSGQCRDTIYKNLYVTDVVAGFALNENRPQCTNIIDIFDTSKMLDPCPDTIGQTCDEIVTYYIDFGEGKGSQMWPADVWRRTKIANNYTRNGDFTITLIVETARGCRDTFEQQIYIPGPQPNFEPITTQEVCVGEVVGFANRSNNPSTSARWIWQYGDGQVSDTDYPKSNGGRDTVFHAYAKAGVYHIYLTQFDSIPGTNKYCPATYPDVTGGAQDTVKVLVRDIDSVRLFANGNPDSIVICPNDVVDFNVTADKSIYSSFIFNFGDGDSTTTPDTLTSHTYLTAGRYIATINPKKNPLLPKLVCPMVDTVIIIVEDVKADFDIDSTGKPNFCFKNTSTGGTSYNWGFFHKDDIVPNSDPLIVDKPMPDEGDVCENYKDSLGTWYICLEATNDNNCKDTICKKISYTYFKKLELYNVFTPGPNSGDDGDGKNDFFVVPIEGHIQYKIQILNRWGQKIFQSENDQEYWNGKVNNTGALCPDGTYFYVVTYTFEDDGEERATNGVITLIREK